MNRDRARATLLGLAIGDALGTTLEFSRPARGGFPRLLDGPHVDITGDGPFHLEPGQVTDDTHMACCLAASLAARRGYDPADVARRYVAWQPHTFDIGVTTAKAIGGLARGDLDAGQKVWLEGNRSGAANGSLMRTAPIGVYFCRDPLRRRAAAVADSALTHYDPRCVLACAAYDAVLASYINDRDDDPLEVARQEITAILLSVANDPLVEVYSSAARELREDLALATAADPLLDGLIHSAMGFVRVAFRLAFWELVHAPSFKAAVIDTVNRGGDSDTNGAITGALLGAKHGMEGIPVAWEERVLGALQDGPESALRDEYHPKVLMGMVEGMD
jgi:ADP-ribosylglycohydrolase